MSLLELQHFIHQWLEEFKMIAKKKKQPESSDGNDSFDYDQGFNVEEVYDQ